MKLWPLLLLICVCAQAQTDPFDLQSTGASDGAFRVWTSAVGTVVRAKFVKLRGDRVILETTEQKQIIVEVTALSQADQAHIKVLSAEGSQPPAGTPAAPSNRATSATASRADRSLPVDDTIEKIPLLRRKSTQPIVFSFYDIVRGKTVGGGEFKGKFVYVHGMYFTEGLGPRLQQLKLLHDKYASHGFEIISIQPYTSRNNPSVISSYEDGAMRRNIRRAIDDYGITWYIAYPAKPGKNPVLSQFADQNYFDWLLDDQTRLIHSNIRTAATLNFGTDLHLVRLPLASALETLFPDAK